MDEKRLIREGVVTAVDASRMTARVTFEDRDALVSGELPILARGSSSAGADYWLPAIGETAVCLFAPNDEESGQGWLLGTRYSERDKPKKSGGRRLTMSDTTIELVEGMLNVSVGGDINLTAGGNVIIKGKQIRLND